MVGATAPERDKWTSGDCCVLHSHQAAGSVVKNFVLSCLVKNFVPFVSFVVKNLSVFSVFSVVKIFRVFRGLSYCLFFQASQHAEDGFIELPMQSHEESLVPKLPREKSLSSKPSKL